MTRRVKARIAARAAGALLAAVLAAPAAAEPPEFPEGTATPAQACGECHQAIYREFAFGFGGDLRYSPTAKVSGAATAHAFAGMDPFPIHARESEEQGRSCNVCHFPEPFAIPNMETAEIAKPRGRPKDQEAGGLTCASCHLTPEGKIRGPHAVEAPHATVADPAMQTSAMCAYCHSLGQRAVGKQTQTFLEWREDFNKPGLGKQHCQDCHMPRTRRKTAEDFDNPERAVARHLWTGGHSRQRLAGALSLAIVQLAEGRSEMTIHVVNVGAGHSVPTGSNRRAVYLVAEALDRKGRAAVRREWMFAPSYGPRPDDRRFLEEDKGRPDAVAAAQADAQGPHESSIRAGEERILHWTPELEPGEYAVRARLIYDLNRYNDRALTEDQTEINGAGLKIKVDGRRQP